VATLPAPVTLRTNPRLTTGLLAVGGFVVLWQLAGSTNAVPADLISYPTQVLAAAMRMTASGELASNAAISLLEFGYGFLPALVLGVGLGLLMGLSRRLRYLLDPLIMALYTPPQFTLLPLLVIWFGIGLESKVAMVFLGALFPIVVNTSTGVQQVDPVLVRAVRAFGGSQLDVVRKVVVPSALPSMMAGIRLGIGRAIIGVVVGEMYVAVAGLGHLVQVYSSAARPAELIVLVMLFALFGLVAVNVARAIEERVGGWRQSLEV
jgi:ABC-type nitrate/sulfonate/bicarbonate transport system permease component